MSKHNFDSEIVVLDGPDDAMEYFFSQGWTDGLPVVPPVARKVQEFLDYAELNPASIIGIESTKGRVITAEKAAINSVMAGCRREYFPIVIAAVEAITEPEFNLHGMSASTMGAAVLIVVNGPVVNEVELNSGVNLFGPGNRANATIGRAVRLILSNVTGASAGILDKATLGHAGKYTWCIAEAESISPWKPLHVEAGYNCLESVVTVYAGLSPIQVSNHESCDPSEILDSFRDAMLATGPMQSEIVVIICPEHIGNIADAGWSRSQVKEYLHLVACRTVSEWEQSGKIPQNIDSKVGGLLHSSRSSEAITLLVAGGQAGAFSSVIPLWKGGSGSRSVSRLVNKA